MKYLSIFLLLIVVCISGCAAGPASRTAVAPPDTAVTSSPEDLVPRSKPDGPLVLPQPGDKKMMRSAVYITQSELLIRESFPPQVSLDIKGNLPTPCHQLRVDIAKPDSENKILVDIYSTADPQRVCAQVLKPFEEHIDLGTFPAGHYTVWVNGDKVGEFDT